MGFGKCRVGIEFFSRACVGVFVSYSKEELITYWTEARCVVVSVDHRLALEHLFLTAVDDWWSTLLWLNTKGEDEL